MEAAQMGVEGYQSGQDRQSKIQEQSLSNMKTMAELEKLKAQLPLYQAQAKMYNSMANGQVQGLQADEGYEEGEEYEDDSTGDRYVIQNGVPVLIS